MKDVTLVDRAESLLLELLEEGNNPNFFFAGDSVLHVAVFNAFVMMMHDKGLQMSGIVCNDIDTSSRKVQFGPESIFSLQSCDFRYVQRSDYPSMTIGHRAARLLTSPVSCKNASAKEASDCYQDVFFLIATDYGFPDWDYWKISSFLGKPVVCVLIEEGAGTYLSFDTAVEFQHQKEDAGIRGVQKFLHRAERSVVARLQKRQEGVIKKNCCFERFTLLERTNTKGFVANDLFAYWVGKAFAKQRELFFDEQRDFSKSVVIVGTNFEEMGPDSLEIDTLRVVVDAISSKGFAAYLRPHPRVKSVDRYAELMIPLDSRPDIPFEVMVADPDTAPKAIVGLGSSSQLISSALWGIPCFSIAGILEDVSEKYDENLGMVKSYIEIVKQVESVFSDFMTPISDFEELVAALARL